jgi:hypothetical protein
VRTARVTNTTTISSLLHLIKQRLQRLLCALPHQSASMLKCATPQGSVRFGLTRHVLPFYFPELCPAAEANAASDIADIMHIPLECPQE